VSTICRHSSRVVAFLQAVTGPNFRGPRSASIARRQAWLGLHIGRFQSGGTCRIVTTARRYSTLNISEMVQDRLIVTMEWNSTRNLHSTDAVLSRVTSIGMT